MTHVISVPMDSVTFGSSFDGSKSACLLCSMFLAVLISRIKISDTVTIVARRHLVHVNSSDSTGSWCELKMWLKNLKKLPKKLRILDNIGILIFLVINN